MSAELHVGLWPDRLKKEQMNSREVAFAERWQIEQNEGRILAWLLTAHKPERQQPPFYSPPLPRETTKRERQVAATVIQWLGSNVGFSFLQVALRNCGYRIEEI